MALFLGVDVGSLSTDGVITDEENKIVKASVVPTGASIPRALEKLKIELFSGNSKMATEISYVVSTGYGRNRVDFADQQITEITAHALGASYFFPDTRTVIDIGGQDTKVIKIADEGRVVDFSMNDKCAAGTGRFLEVMARLLETDLEEMAQIALNSKTEEKITSTCTVFIESEIISLLSENTDHGAIAKGVFKSIATRILSMVKGLQCSEPFMLSGGVSKNPAMVAALKEILASDVRIPADPQITGALGCSIFACRKFRTSL